MALPFNGTVMFRAVAAVALALLIGVGNAVPADAVAPDTVQDKALMDTLKQLSGLGDRSTGTPGAHRAAAFIKETFRELGFDGVGSQTFGVAVRRHTSCLLHLPGRSEPIQLDPLVSNAVTPGSIAEPGLEGPLVYVGDGSLDQINGKPIAGAIILMELISARNWVNVAALGARALIYLDRGVDRGGMPRFFYEDKLELSPINFPRFRISIETVQAYLGSLMAATNTPIFPNVRLSATARWELAGAENIYCRIPGRDARLSDRAILVEAFYDSTARVPGCSPGADEAAGIATLLRLARLLKDHPPARTVILVASAGHAQTLAGMRELIWSLDARSLDLHKQQRELKKVIAHTRRLSQFLAQADLQNPQWLADTQTLKDALAAQIKTQVDTIARKLMQLRLEEHSPSDNRLLQDLADQRLMLRRLDWRSDYQNLSPVERNILAGLIPEALEEFRAVAADAHRELDDLESATRFRSMVKRYDLDAVISLHLSSHGDGVGAFNYGWLYPLKPTINRVSAYSRIDEVIRDGAEKIQQAEGLPVLYKDSLRPSRIKPWESYFADRPPLGGEVSALAGMIGLSLVTTDDARMFWGTPSDTLAHVDQERLIIQSRWICGLIHFLCQAPRLHEEIYPRNGFGTITGRAKFLRHGELFPDQPAPGSLLLSYQGPARYHNLVDARGIFRIKGVADKKHTLHKVIIEGYRFDSDSGDVIWAIDKAQTGKDAYRVKMQRRFMETDLIMFACRQTTLFNLLEPRTFSYLTKLQLLDGRLEAPPVRYWYSRIDTRRSVLCSIYLDPGTRLKLILSDSLLKNKLILTHGTPDDPMGIGYHIDDWPRIAPTELHVAQDMWTLLGPRIANLENRGIHDQRIRDLEQAGRQALSDAQAALEQRIYDRFFEASRKSWALAMRVYDQVEKIQKDVLFGVLFYIALFIPFAFCMERFLFSHRNIYKRIGAFLAILGVLIGVIYQVHPAFRLAYSPMVVILAFFIIGLSVMVAVIIFLRFEEEMILVQRHANKMRAEETSMWKAFSASFFLGVSNLRRRRLRTVLTCTTLVILTFTIMSFTSVKSQRHHSRVQFNQRAPYAGFLFKNINWQDFPPEAIGILQSAFGRGATVAPRVWLEGEDNTVAPRITIQRGPAHFEARALLGLSWREPQISGLDRILTAGRWLQAGETDAIILSARMAETLAIDPRELPASAVFLWGMPFRVVGIFAPQQMERYHDLDGEVLTPVIYPDEASRQITEIEMEALESGEDVRTFQSRYQHLAAELAAIIPHETLLAAGGRLKSIAVKAGSAADVQQQANALVDRFGLALFSGEPQGIFLYQASNTLAYSGVPNILIPMLISIFIVLNTMISSVYERKREIGIYTSVGLAPSHVAFLFIAESLAFAVISVVLGYLLAQTTAKFCGDSALWRGITVNYSSLSGVAAMLLVIFVVVVSALYPAKMAAEIAIPDVKKSWHLPQAFGNTIEIALPFLMKRGEDRSVGGFLFDYFNRHQDVSHGLFAVADLSWERLSADGAIRENSSTPASDPSPILLQSRIWLTPFDLGIMQQVRLSILPSSEEPGFMQIEIRLTRESGEANAWRRTNRRFIHHLRKQLLIWRSLDLASKKDFETLLLKAV